MPADRRALELEISRLRAEPADLETGGGKTPEIVLVAGANYAKYKGGSLHAAGAGAWRTLCLRMALRHLQKSAPPRVTLFDFFKGTRETVALSGGKLKPSVVKSFSPLDKNDYRQLLLPTGIFAEDVLKHDGERLRKLTPKPVSSKDHAAKVAYFDGATASTTVKKLSDYLALGSVAAPTLSIEDVYAYIEQVGKSSPGTIREFHIFSHAGNTFGDRPHHSGGPILVNSLDLAPTQPGRFALDKDCRAKKDFQPGNRKLADFAAAFADDALSFLWGCDTQRGFPRRLEAEVARWMTTNSSRNLKSTDVVLKDIQWTEDQWRRKEDFAHFTGMALSDVGTKKVSLTLGEIETIFKELEDGDYSKALARASRRPCIAAAPATYATFDLSSGNRIDDLLHVPMGTGKGGDKDVLRPAPAEKKVSYRLWLQFLEKNFGAKFDKTYGGRSDFGRGYMRYTP